MTKRRDQPSKMRLRARPIGSSPRWTSGKILIQAFILSVLMALFVAVAIPVLHLITPSNTRPKHLADLQFVSEPTPTPAPATRPASMLTNANPTYCGTVATVLAGNSTQSVHPAAVPSLTPTSEPVIIVNGTQQDCLEQAARPLSGNAGKPNVNGRDWKRCIEII